MVRVRDGDFSYIVSPLDGDKSDCFFYEWVSTRDFYIERDWNTVLNKEVIFSFNNNL